MYAYDLDCGHKFSSPFRRTPGALVRCTSGDRWMPCGARHLVAGDFAELLGTQAQRDNGYDLTPVYTVWRRHPDGLVSSSAGSTAPKGDGRDTFETLLVTDEWITARAIIRIERVSAEMNNDLITAGTI